MAASVIGLAILAGLFAGRRPASTPTVRQITFDRGTVRAARFTADLSSIVYSAAWGGRPIRTFMTRTDSENRESTDLGLPDAGLLSVSDKGQMALSHIPFGILFNRHIDKTKAAFLLE